MRYVRGNPFENIEPWNMHLLQVMKEHICNVVDDAFCRYYPLYLVPTLEEGDLENKTGMKPTPNWRFHISSHGLHNPQKHQ